LGGGLDGVDGGPQGPIRAVLEPERHGKAGSHLAMGLRFRGAGSDSRPANQIRNVLGGDGVEEFRRSGEAEINDLLQELSGGAQSRRDVVGAIKVRIHDEPLPSHRRAGFFEVHPHHHHDPIGHRPGEVSEFAGVFATRVDVVNGTRSDDEKEPFVLGEDDAVNVIPGASDKLRLGGGFGKLIEQRHRGRQLVRREDIDVGRSLHESATLKQGRRAGQDSAPDW
jgi:cobaltochelatase CobN